VVGIGSAGLLSCNLLVEGHTQALENDVVLFVKQGQVPAVSAVADDPVVRGDFLHQGTARPRPRRRSRPHRRSRNSHDWKGPVRPAPP
jgi:hypothetical protein